MQGRQKEWARWKYFVMARSQKEYLALRQLFSGNQWSEEKNKQFYQHLNTVQNLPINLKAQRNGSIPRRKTAFFYFFGSND